MGAALGAGLLVVLVGLLARRRPGVRSGPTRVPQFPSLDRFRGRSTLGEPISLLQLRTAVAHGASLTQAFSVVADGGGAWADGAGRVRARVRAGTALQEALDQWVDEDPDPTVALVADALAVAAGSGGSLVRAIDAVIDAARERAALHREVRALASQAQASALVLVVMPLLFAVAVALLDGRIRAFYVGSLAGPVCLAVGASLDAGGSWWMHRLVRRVS